MGIVLSFSTPNIWDEGYINKPKTLDYDTRKIGNTLY